jgi:hypothetical protein
VFSRTLRSADWAGTRIASGDTAEEIAKLKAEPGGDIVVSGGTQFQRSVIRLGLVDEYRLWVLPAAAGQGAALFSGLAPEAAPGGKHGLPVLGDTRTGVLASRLAPAAGRRGAGRWAGTTARSG